MRSDFYMGFSTKGATKMPYKVKKTGKNCYKVVKAATGKDAGLKKGCYAFPRQAYAQIKAVEMSEKRRRHK